MTGFEAIAAGCGPARLSVAKVIDRLTVAQFIAAIKTNLTGWLQAHAYAAGL
jgi:hypothetical protein